MAKELQTILVSGEITDIRLGGTDALKKLLTEEEILALLPALHTYARWKGPWDSSLSYYINDMVNDGGWLMYCEADLTTERAAPQAMYEVQTEYYPDTEAGSMSASPYPGYVVFGHKYTVRNEGYIDSVEILVPEVTGDDRFDAWFITYNANGEEMATRLPVIEIVADTWHKLEIPKTFFREGDTFAVKVSALRATGMPGGTMPFNLRVDGADPSTGQISWVNDETLKISKTNADASDVSSAIMGLIVGSLIMIADDPADPQVYKDFEVTVPPIEGGTFAYIEVQLRGKKGDITTLDGDRLDISFEEPSYLSVPYYVDTTHTFPTPNYYAPFATVEPILELDAVPSASGDELFGIRVWFQPAYLSQDWSPMIAGA